MWLKELPYAILLACSSLLGMYLSNVFYDLKVPNYLTRKISHFSGCVAFLMMPFLFTSFWYPEILVIGFTGLLLYARWVRPSMFRGVGGSGRPDAIAEVHFPATGIVLIGVLWGIYNQPWLAIIPLTFLGAGDGITGIIRSQVYKKEVKGLWGTWGMLLTCLLLSYFIHPYYLGVAGTIVAVLAERYTKTRRFIDDNLTIPILSGLVMGLLWFYLVR